MQSVTKMLLLWEFVLFVVPAKSTVKVPIFKLTCYRFGSPCNRGHTFPEYHSYLRHLLHFLTYLAFEPKYIQLLAFASVCIYLADKGQTVEFGTAVPCLETTLPC